MHTFQPYPIDMLDINPFTKLSKEWALVTAGDKEKSNTMTVSWGGTGVLWGKNVVFIFIRESRYTKDFIDNGEFFSLSFLSEKYRDALKYCGAHSGRGEDKWSKAGLTLLHAMAYHIRMRQILYSSAVRWLLCLLKRLHLQTKPLCINGTAITICTLCMLVKLLRLRLANLLQYYGTRRTLICIYALKTTWLR